MTPDRTALAFGELFGGVRGELDRGGRMLRWIEAGDGEPAVVFEAGAATPVVGFAACLKALAPDHRVIAYDRAGYGVSDPVPLGLDQQIGDLIAVLEAAGPSILVGHSWGGLLAELAAWEHPELIAGLVLVDPSHESVHALHAKLAPPQVVAELRRHPSRSTPASEDSRSADLLESARQRAAQVARSVGGDHQDQLVEAYLSYLETDEQLFTQLDEVPMAVDHTDDIAVRRAQSVWPQVPVVVLTATKGKPAPVLEPMMAVQNELVAAANGRHVVVPDAGHDLHVDRPDLVIQAVRDVAAGLDSHGG
ncbi:hypothetical protein BWI15_22945 [Kribbella sp. ALI-6-A]|uniref:alpha/beta fold hydrolase n=1 Tax=Kribbella sp. ALI-6-A TaxID=1933817 RepID=UPI00097C9770|nr:alpha/beta hydrolase [Kribbella sp. ALI-6-A]ONI69440.1 hypothetical protein BWI15_22945 [Kribbella sp. ALI-6-A]